MSQVHHLQLPVGEAQVRALKLGDAVTLSGEIVITAGMPTHQRMVDHLAAGTPLPIDLRGGALIHFGGQAREVDGGVQILYMNPTTSTRFNPFMPTLIAGHGLRIVGGKGGLDAASAAAMRQAGCVYLSFPGGGCSLLSQAIREVVAVEWRDLLLHYRLVKLRVDRLGPGTVGIDAHGASLFDGLQAEAAARLPGLLAQLERARVTPPA